MSNSRLQAKLTYTEEEWNIINNVLCRQYHPDDNMHDWIRKNIEQLSNNKHIIESLSTTNISPTYHLNHYISEHQIPFFKELSNKRGLVPATAINRLIIVPALAEYIVENGFKKVSFQ